MGGDICVSASRAGPARVWHPTCFTCSCCQVRNLGKQKIHILFGKLPCQKYVYSEMIYHDTNCVKAHSKEACFQFIHPSNCYRVENVDVSTKIFSVSREKYLYLCPGTVLSLRVSTCDVTGPGRCWKQIQLEINLLSLVCVMSLVIISHHFRSFWWI